MTCEQPRTARPLGDRTHLCRPGGRDPLLARLDRGVAVPTGVTPLAGAEHEEPGRVQVQLLGRLLADALALPTAGRTALLVVGQVVDHVPTFEVLGQRRTTVLVAPSRGLRVGGYGRGLLALAAAAEPVPGGRAELGLQLGVLGAQPRHLDQQFTDQHLERGHVGRGRGVGIGREGVHARNDDRGARDGPAKSVNRVPVSAARTA